MSNDVPDDAAEADGAFIEVDEDDPFVLIRLQAVVESGHSFTAGSVVAEPGRYELRRVDSEAGDDD